ncbi:kinase-like protein [Zopfia rhizophila CBS 207.26]|uniref:mitogen-activated protein kinase kinase n=1 Tax=Zopfia rhizophila CBS 207.26 TaxID=1314779 RepID=A0A6A6E198_9PEZI|nr:kinase-like protein [Zopfia rhizophila CBS 207.26]
MPSSHATLNNRHGKRSSTLFLLTDMERASSAFPPLTHTPKLEIEEGKAYPIDDNERLPYQLLRNLGHGHSGNVEEVKDINTGRVFARKIIRIPRGRSGEDRKKIFDNEIKIIRSLTGHHHVIQVFATYVSKYEVGLILYPVADEGDLERFLESVSQSLPDCESPGISDTDKAKVDILKRSFGCLASGLEFMHQRKIRHKDVKPRNILVHQGSVIYTDFGYSLDSSLEGHSTTTGQPDFLTRRYSAPEVVDFMPRNSRSDVFSLGCVFLDVLSTLTKVLDIDSDQCYYERMSSIHTQMSGSNIPTSLEFLVKIITSMTLTNAAERSTAAEVAGKLRGYPGFLCDRCQPPQITKLPLRRPRDMIEPGNSNNTSQEPVPVICTEATSGRGPDFAPDFYRAQNDAGNAKLETPEEMQRNDSLAPQIWKLYSKAKTQLPNAELMENLTWRMMAMNMRRVALDRNKGQAQASAMNPPPMAAASARPAPRTAPSGIA